MKIKIKDDADSAAGEAAAFMAESARAAVASWQGNIPERMKQE